MTLYLSNRDGNGKTSEEGHYKFQTGVWTGSTLYDSAFKVTQNSPLNLSVLVSAGQIKIDTTGDYAYTGWNTTNETVTIPTADPANPRISTIVAYVDKSASTSPTPPNNPGILKLASVQGTPNAVPVAPNNSTIQSFVGSGNPFTILADVRINAGATQATNANITDRRTTVALGANLVNNQALVDSAVTAGKLASSSVTTAKIDSSAVTTAKVDNGAITTAKFRPSIIASNFALTGARYTTPAAQNYYAIPNASMTYTAGATNETLLLWTSAMAQKNTSGNSELYLYVNGVANGMTAYLEAANSWYRMNIQHTIDVAAGATVTLSVVIYNAGTTTTSVITEVSRWKPSIMGFSVYRP